jgi:hypothetical protein
MPVVAMSNDFPYRALDRNKQDTTFDFQVLKKPILTKLPTSIFGKEVVGNVEFYATINQNKEITDLQINFYDFYHKRKQICQYNYAVNAPNELNTDFKNYLLNFIKTKPFIQTKRIEPTIHQTYCFIRFI